MKIVIDIDNEAYGRIQALVNADYFEHDICGYSMQRIANGTPYEEIPSEAVIEKIIELCKDITIVNQNGIYRPVKNTSAQECYRALFEIIKLIRRGEEDA